MKYLTFFFFMLFYFFSNAQNSIDRKKISIEFKNDKLSDVFIKIASLSNRNISFSDSLINNITITKTFTNLSVEEILFDLSRKLNFTATFGKDSSLIIIPKSSIYKGNLISYVVDKESNLPIEGSSFVLPDLQVGGISDSSGKVSIAEISAGLYRYKIQCLGYRTVIGIIGIRPDNENFFLFKLDQSDIEFPEVLILSPVNSLSNLDFDFRPIKIKELQKPLNYFSDIFKSVQAIPGIQGDEYSSGFNIRGGNPDETLVILDGLELYSPFHFDDFFRIASIIEPSSIGKSEIIRGGFSSAFGNKMSGVFKLSSLTGSTDSWTTSVSNSTIHGHFYKTTENLKFLFSIKYADERMIYKNAYDSDNLIPEYWSIYSKLVFDQSDKNVFSIHYLHSGDQLNVRRTDKIWTPNFDSYKSSHLIWANWISTINSDFIFHSTVFQQFISKRTDFDFKNDLTPNNYDYRNYNIPGINFSVDWTVNNNHSLTFGSQLHFFDLNYKFHETRFGSNIVEFDSVNINNNKRYFLLSSFIDHSFLFSKNITLQSGIRIDKVSFSDQPMIDPRVTIVFNPKENIQLKMGIGYYSQFQTLTDYDLALNKIEYSKPERSIQYTLEFDHFLPNQIHYNISPYFKNYFQLNDDLIFGFDERYHLFNPPKDTLAITNGKSYGIDFLIKQDQDIFSWQINYDYNKSKLISSTETFNRSFEQNHKVDIIFEIKLPENLSFNFFFRSQSGMPFTNQVNPKLQPELYPQAFFVDYEKHNDKFTNRMEFLKLKLTKSVEFKYVHAEFYFGFYNLLNYQPDSFKHIVTKEQKSVIINIDQKFVIPRLAFFGIEFSNL